MPERENEGVTLRLRWHWHLVVCLFVCPAMPKFRSAIRFHLVLGIRFDCHKLESMKTNDCMQRQHTPFLSKMISMERNLWCANDWNYNKATQQHDL